VTHYIIPDRPFALTCAVLLEDGDCNIHYEEKGSQNAAKKAASNLSPSSRHVFCSKIGRLSRSSAVRL
jgi:hypothetical protein